MDWRTSFGQNSSREFALLLLALTAVPLLAKTAAGSSGPDFSMFVDPSNVSGNGYVQVGVILTSLDNFSGLVTLHVSAPYLVYSLSQNPVMLHANASLTVTLTLVNYQGSGVTGADSIQASSGSIIHLVFVSVSIYGTGPDFMLTNSPSTIYTVPGFSITDVITVSSTASFNGLVTLNATEPTQSTNGTHVSLSPTTLDASISSSPTTILTFTASYATPLGQYPITITATGKFQGIPLTHQLALTANVISSSLPPQPSQGVYYKLLYTEAHPGRTVTFVNQFTDSTDYPAQIESIDIKLDFAEYIWQATGNYLPLVLQPGETSMVNMSETIPTTAFLGTHRLAVTVTFQIQTRVGWTSENPFTIQGSITISPSPSAPAILPTVDVVTLTIGLASSVYRSPLVLVGVIAYFISTVAMSIFVARWDERRRRATLSAH